jgi:hypothetical protein
MPLGCGGDDEPAAPLALDKRLPTDEEAAGFAVQRRFTWPDADGPVEEGFAATLNNPETQDEAKKMLRDAGYVEGAAVVRSRAENDNLVVMVLRLGSEDGARDVLEWEHREELKPCPGVCNVRISEFDVGGIDDAKGIQRLVGQPIAGQESPPYDRFLVDFTDGTVLYLVERAAPPGTATRQDAVDLAKKLRERVAGAPFPAG